MDDMSYSIGELARLGGVTVKTVRFYADRGIVPEEGRTAAGHRRFGAAALPRLALVRTLRELGLDLAAVRDIVDSRVPAAEAAAVHAEAIAVRMRVLRLRHAVLAVAARRGSTPEEMDLMHRFARLSAAERDSLVAGFLDSAFGDPGRSPLARVARRSLAPELPDDPTSEQLAAWVELAELVQDDGFRTLMRGLFTDHAAADAHRPPAPPRKHVVALIAEAVPPLLAAGTAPGSPEAAPTVDRIAAAFADSQNDSDGPALRARLAAHLAAASDPRRERYLELLSVVNGWARPRHPTRELRWFRTALGAGPA